MPPVNTDELHARRAGRSAGDPGPAPGRSAALLLKHLIDRLVAACGLIVTAPLMLVLVLALLGRGPVLVRDRRLGERNRIVGVLSFAIGEELRRRRGWRLLADSGITALPQLWNVARGELSLVGPRPRELGLAPPPARPGLTGLAQVRRGYETSMAEKLAHDLEWIADRSVRLYLRTLASTAWRVLRQSARGVVRPP
jgi:lipopolysaccharide/colanic/teichoic acid biosynthesis glycosyltransferase